MKKIKFYFKLIFSKPSTSLTVKELEDYNRLKSLSLTAVTGAIAKLFQLIVPLITVKIMLDYLGKDIYGLYTAVMSLFFLFQFADFGLGSGLKTLLSKSYGKEDYIESRKMISSTLFFLVLVSFVLIAAFLLIFPFINWSNILNTQTNETTSIAGAVVFAIVLSKILQVPLSIVQRIQLSLQEGYKYNLWAIFASILTLVSIYLSAYFLIGKVEMIWISSMVVVVVLLINIYIYFALDKKDLRPNINFVDKKYIKIMFNIGILFFVLSVLSSVGLALDNFIVARVLSLNEAATYGIINKLARIISGITVMFAAPLWTANANAIAKGQHFWVEKVTRKMSFLLLGISLLGGLILVVFIRPFISLWLNEDLSFSIIMVIGMVVMQSLLSLVTSYFMLLNAYGKVKIQIFLFLLYTPIAILLKFFFGNKYGMIAIPWVGSIIYLIIIVVPVIIIANKHVRLISKNQKEDYYV